MIQLTTQHSPAPDAGALLPALSRSCRPLGTALALTGLLLAAHPAGAQLADAGLAPKVATARQQAAEERFPEQESPDGCGAEAIRRTEQPSGPLRGTFDPDTVGFSLKFKDEISPYRVMSTFVLPGKKLKVEAVLADKQSRFQACAQGGTLERTGKDKWTWKAPKQPGLYRLYVTDTWAEETQRLNLFVMVPYDGQRVLDGYRIGQYQRQALYDNPVYDMPRGMVRLDGPEDLETWLSPHFQIGQFVCKQGGGWPKFLIVGERMLLKLEMLLEEVNEEGIEARTFSVLSGFRTPQYNADIGNRTKYSRHTYGDAADIFVDEDGDGSMDDLDGDGRVTVEDAKVLQRIVEGLVDDSRYQPFIGGLGLYGPKPHRGPFIHVDTRGFRARW